MTDAVVVGSGPNGLAAALTLADAGVEVEVIEAADRLGGGLRSAELTVPGLVHDICSAFHPTGVGSPFFRARDLERWGLRWLWPEIELAHPLDGGRAALLHRDLEKTAAGLGPDGPRWTATVGWTGEHFDDLAEDALRPIIHLPRHPLLLARFGAMALLPATALARTFRTTEARALFGGVAAHAFSSLSAPLSSAVGVMLAGAGHACGWPVSEGGSERIADAMIAEARHLGVTFRTDERVTGLAQVGDRDLVLLDTTPSAASSILGDRLPKRVRRAYRRFRPGPAAHKIDLAIEGPIPWENPDVGRAGTVHLGGTFEEIAAAEAEAVAGRLPRRPFALLGQQAVADPSRAPADGDLQPIYLYGHVPHGHRDDPAATEAILAQVERFAPGFRDRIRSMVVTGPRGLEATNPNLAGGDIAGGASSGLQVLMRPRIAVDPYSTGIPGIYLCSASTPPGGGVSGMPGANAATSALKSLRRR